MSRFRTAAIGLCAVLVLGAKCSLFNKAPSVPTVAGPSEGAAGVPVTFTATTTDPDGDSVAFQFDWGDNSTLEWTAFLASGATCTTQHTYADSGTFTIKAKAKDKSGKESDWSTAHTVALMAAGSPYPDSLVGDIIVPLNAWASAATPDGLFLYTIHRGDSHFLSRVRLADGIVTDSVRLQAEPGAIAIHPDGSKLFVVCNDAGTVIAMTLPELRVMATTPVGDQPGEMGISPDGRFVYVVTNGTDVAVLRASDCQLLDSFRVGDNAGDLCVDARLNQVYASIREGVAYFSADSSPVVSHGGTGFSLGRMGISKDGQSLFGSSSADSGVAAVHVSDWSVAARYNLHLMYGVMDVAALRDSVHIVGSRWNGVVFINTGLGSVVDSLVLNGQGQFCQTPSGDSLFYTTGRHVYVIAHR